MFRPLLAAGLLAGLAACGFGGSSDGGGPETPVAPPRVSEIGDGCGGGALPRQFNQIMPRAGQHSAETLDLAVMLLTNQARCANGLEPLVGSPALRQAAYLHSGDMAREDFFSHDSPVQGRETLGRRMAQVGMDNRFGAENIIDARYMAYQSGRKFQIVDQASCRFAYEDGTPIPAQTYASLAAELVQRWMDSPGHRANILNKGMREHGFAAVPSKSTSLCGGILATQVFAR